MNADITLELLTQENIDIIKEIQRDDISEAYVDTMENIAELTLYGINHKCKGHTFAIKYENNCIGVIIIGEAFPWSTDPEEMRRTPFYRLMGFVIDRRFRNIGIGAFVLEEAINRVYANFGIRPIALGVHKDNIAAERFYLKHGFTKTNAMEGNDYYYLRYPNNAK